MTNNVTLKMEFKTPDVHATLSLMELLKNGLQRLMDLCKGIHHMEVYLYDQEAEANKFAQCKITGDKGSFTVYQQSKRWEDALLDALDQVHHRMR